MILALDTATLSLSAALVTLDGAGEVVACRASPPASGRGLHSRLLPGVLLELLAAEGVTLADIDGLAVGLGPGSFTGLRTGLSTMKALAYAARRPLAGASSLAAMAFEAGAAGDDTLLVPVLDARRGQVYAGFYRRTREGVAPEADDAVLDPASVLEAIAGHAGPVRLFGEGRAAHPALAGADVPGDGPATPAAVAVARLAAPDLGAYHRETVLSLRPRYVRRSEAELKREAGTLRIPGLTEPVGGSD